MRIPLISICIPTYSRLAYLQEAVQSALNQTYTNIEVCISQDFTPNGLNKEIAEWCHQQTQADRRIIYHANEKNLGLAGNWNQLVSIAKGEYIIIIGDDDVLSPEFIERAVRWGISENADVAFCDQYFINENGEILKDYTERMSQVYGRENLKQGALKDPVKNVFDNSIPMSASIIKKHWLERFKFNETVNTPEFEIFLRIALNNGLFYFVKEKLAFYRVHFLSATSGGLTIDLLLANIVDINVESNYEQFKYKFVSEKITPAVNRALLQNNKVLAKKLLNSSYYPNKIEKYIQIILLYLPISWVKKII